MAGAQCPGEVGRGLASPAGGPASVPSSAANLGEAQPASAPHAQKGRIYGPDLPGAVKTADEKVLSRN